MKKSGVPLSINEFLNLSKEYASSLKKSDIFPSKGPAYDWFRSFLKRHQNLILKKSRPLEQKRASLTSEQVDKCFDLLEKVIRESNLENRPGQIFNCNETGIGKIRTCLTNFAGVLVLL